MSVRAARLHLHSGGGPISGPYDTDIALWSEQQARLLRRHAARKPVNNDDLDWQNIAEEIESLAKSDRREIRNRLAVASARTC